MSQILVCKTGDYIICTNMRERAKRASASELEQYILMKSPKVSMDCC